MSIRAIIGPQGCGKTINASTLKRLYKAKRIVDEGDRRITKESLRDGDLVLCTERLFKNKHNKPDIEYIQWSDVLKEHRLNLIIPHNWIC